jgi:hypothetical protein
MGVRYDKVGSVCSGKCQVGLLRLRDDTANRFQAEEFLGCYNCRNTRTGTSLSLHAEGRALDYRFATRQEMERAWGFWIGNKDALQIQAIHDYELSLLWKDDGQGWRRASIGEGAGGHTTHVERNWTGALDPRTITEILIPKLLTEVKVTPQYNFDIPFVRGTSKGDNGGFWLVDKFGHVFAFEGASWQGNAAGRQFFAFREAADIEPRQPTDAPGVYTIIATSGERYTFPSSGK